MAKWRVAQDSKRVAAASAAAATASTKDTKNKINKSLCIVRVAVMALAKMILPYAAEASFVSNGSVVVWIAYSFSLPFSLLLSGSIHFSADKTVDMWKIMPEHKTHTRLQCVYRKYKVGFVSVPFSTQ